MEPMLPALSRAEILPCPTTPQLNVAAEWLFQHPEPNLNGVVLGMFTFASFRQQGFAKRLLAFSVSQMLQDYPAVKLWVDDDNHGAIALYRSLGFRPVGALYIGYFQPVNRTPHLSRANGVSQMSG